MTIAAPPTANSPAARTLDIRDRPHQRSPVVPLPLGEILLSHGLLTEEELESALAERGAKGGQLGEVLVQLGFVDEETLLRCLGQQLQIPVVRLRDGLVDPAVVKVLPRTKAEALCALALFRV